LCPSLVKGKYIIRFAICAKSSKQEDIDYSWKEIQRCAELVLKESEEFFAQRTSQPIKQTSTPIKMASTTTNNKSVTVTNKINDEQTETPMNLNGTGLKSLVNGKMNAAAISSLNRSMSDISVVSLPRFNDLKTAYANLLEAAGEDISREGLLKTPERAAKAFQFFTGGYHQDLRGK